MGAAVASHTVVDTPGRKDVAGLFFFSYPIPRRPNGHTIHTNPERLNSRSALKAPVASVKLETKRIPWTGNHQISGVYATSPTIRATSPTALVIAHGVGKSMSSRFITFFHVEMARRGFLTPRTQKKFLSDVTEEFSTRSDLNTAQKNWS